MISFNIITVCSVLWMCSQAHALWIPQPCGNLVDTLLQYFGKREPDLGLTTIMLSDDEKRKVTFIVSYPDSRSKERLSSELKYNEAHKLGSLVSFNKNMKTMFVTHGFLSSREFLADFETPVTGKQIIIIGLDWSEYSGSNAIEYGEIAGRVGVIGELVGQFLFKAIMDGHILWKELHLVGHSLGGQITGYISQTLRKLHPKYVEHGVPLITALDPALPGFKKLPMDFRLNDMDAIRVEVPIQTHTNRKKLFNWDSESKTNSGLPIENDITILD